MQGFQAAVIVLGWCSPDAHPAPLPLLPLSGTRGGTKREKFVEEGKDREIACQLLSGVKT